MKPKKQTAGETAKKTAEKQDKKTSSADYLKNRVVLALSKEQAIELNKILVYCIKNRSATGDESFPGAERLSERLTKTLKKREGK